MNRNGKGYTDSKFIFLVPNNFELFTNWYMYSYDVTLA